MNIPIVKCLVLKDLYLHRYPILGLALALPVVGIVPALFGGETMWRQMGLTILNNSLIYLIFFLPIATVIMERKNHTLPFLMSLPVSYKEYTASKVVGSLVVFAVACCVVALALPAIVARSEQLARGVLPLMGVILGVYVVLFVLTLGICLVTESFLWTMVLGLLSVVFAFLVFPLLESIPPHLIEHWAGERVVWDSEVVTALGLELLVAIVAITATFALQKRKKDFL
jgi:ABC-type transport system involved in multi-copper enzyme maturation permease subunit